MLGQNITGVFPEDLLHLPVAADMLYGWVTLVEVLIYLPLGVPRKVAAQLLNYLRRVRLLVPSGPFVRVSERVLVGRQLSELVAC